MTDSELKAIATGLAPVLREFVDSRVRERLNEIIAAVNQQRKQNSEYSVHLDELETRVMHQLDQLRSEVYDENG